MTVRSSDMKDGQVVAESPKAPALRLPSAGGARVVWLALGVLALAFAVPGWLIGARLTLAGWLTAAGAMAEMFGFDVRPALSAGLPLLLGSLAAGVVYSLAEVAGRPLRRAGGRWALQPFWVWIVYALTLGTDYVSTAAGLLWPDLTTWPQGLRPALVWASADLSRLGVVTVLLTHYPELLMIGALYALRRATR